MDEKTDVVSCSFCKKTQNDVRKLIAGPAVNICDECVEICVDIIMDDRSGEGRAPDSAEIQRRHSIAAKFGRGPQACGFCGAEALTEALLSIEGRGVLCGDCADAIEDALSRGRPID